MRVCSIACFHTSCTALLHAARAAWLRCSSLATSAAAFADSGVISIIYALFGALSIAGLRKAWTPLRSISRAARPSRSILRLRAGCLGLRVVRCCSVHLRRCISSLPVRMVPSLRVSRHVLVQARASVVLPAFCVRAQILLPACLFRLLLTLLALCLGACVQAGALVPVQLLRKKS